MYGYSNNNNLYGYSGYSNVGYGYDNRPQMQAQQMQMPQTAQAPTPQNQIIWVQGEAGAKSYLVARGETAVLWDSENPYIYIKSADMSGMPSMRIFEIAEKTGNIQNVAKVDTIEYVTRTEFDELKRQFAEFNHSESVSVPVAKETTKKGSANNG